MTFMGIFLFSGFSNFQHIIYSVHDELLFGVIIDEFRTSFDIGTNKSKLLWTTNSYMRP
jgi:hypothetical protein